MTRVLLVALAAVPGLWAFARLHAQNAPAESVLRVVGNVAKPQNYTNAQLQKAFEKDIQIVRYDLRGEKGRAHAIPLLALLRAAQPELDPKRKNALLAYAVVVSAGDGYAVTFSTGELLPEVGKRDVYLALDRNDGPLPEEEAPARLLVPADGKPARWLYGITTIRLLNTAALPPEK
jgi:DMSO/TMAO reductase YedYZ molybdopterin-dependent catalytic subunit